MNLPIQKNRSLKRNRECKEIFNEEDNTFSFSLIILLKKERSSQAKCKIKMQFCQVVEIWKLAKNEIP
jgi:hypothetical protein